jgi:hypothetical protein
VVLEINVVLAFVVPNERACAFWRSKSTLHPHSFLYIKVVLTLDISFGVASMRKWKIIKKSLNIRLYHVFFNLCELVKSTMLMGKFQVQVMHQNWFFNFNECQCLLVRFCDVRHWDPMLPGAHEERKGNYVWLVTRWFGRFSPFP